jgi:hypothetical protein
MVGCISNFHYLDEVDLDACMVATIIYVDRLRDKIKIDRYTMFAVSFMIALKINLDNSFLGISHFKKAVGIKKQRLIENEIKFCEALDYRLNIQRSVFNDVQNALIKLEIREMVGDITWGDDVKSAIIAANVFAINSGLMSLSWELVLYFIIAKFGSCNNLIKNHQTIETTLITKILKNKKEEQYYSDELIKAIHSSLVNDEIIMSTFVRELTDLFNHNYVLNNQIHKK